MDLGLNGRIVLITGGSKGIGLACASAFAAEGCRAMDGKFFSTLNVVDPMVKRMAARGHGVILNVIGATNPVIL